MGYYIDIDSKGNPLPAKGKSKALLSDGAIMAGAKYQENLVCVVENGSFDAAGYIYSQREFDDFNHPDDIRVKTWLIHPEAKRLSNYEK